MLSPPRDTQYIHRIEGGQSLSVDESREFAKSLDVDVSNIIDDSPRARVVSLVGYVGAGDLYAWDPASGPWVGFDIVEAPPGDDDVVAVRVRGDSMAPVYRDGDLLYFTKAGVPTTECAGEDCMVRVRNGAAYIKLVMRGPRANRYNLCSYNHDTAEIENADIEWSSPILWAKRGKRGKT